MLEERHADKIDELVSKLPCDVELPGEWHDFFSQQGFRQPIPDDRRRYARRYMPAKAILEITDPLPAYGREQLVLAVYTRDISREGVSFLISDQLFPSESGRLWLSDRRLAIEVACCRRLNSRCFIVGATATE